jgi:hypothetical protein
MLYSGTSCQQPDRPHSRTRSPQARTGLSPIRHGAPSFFIRDKKMFVSFLNDHHGDGKLALWCAAPLGLQEDLVRARPERYFVPAYVGHLGWVGVRLDGEEDWEAVAQSIREAWRTVAPKALGTRRTPAARAKRAT